MACRCRHEAGPHDHVRNGEFQRGGIAFGAKLNSAIDFTKVQAWNCQQNQAEVSAVLNIDVTDPAPPEALQSDADEELLLHVPFTEFIKLRGISIIGGGGQESPSKVKLYASRNDVTGFDSIGRAEATDTIDAKAT